jgi:Helix-turn-helix domain
MMSEISVITPEQRLTRFLGLMEERQREEEQSEKAKKNKNFVQFYPSGFERIKSLIEAKQPTALKLYLFFAEHMEPGTGAVVASQQLLADELEVSVRTIKTVSKYLEDLGAIIRIRLGAGTVYAYCLDPNEVWKSWDTSKKYAAFNTKTLARQKDNGDIKRRLMVMLKGKDPSDVESDT